MAEIKKVRTGHLLPESKIAQKASEARHQAR